MKNIGFVEKLDSEKVDMIKFLVDSAKGIDTIKITKEVSPMTDETTTVAEATEEVVADVEVAPEVETIEETVEEDAEEATEEVDEKADSVEVTEDSLAKSDEVLVDAVADIKDSLTSAFSDLADTVKSLYEHVSELTKSLDSVKAEVADAKGDFNEFGKRVDAVEADTAFRKSGDLGEIVQDIQSEQIEKSLWGGRFLKTADL
jgi:chromosome segregation ATPase